MFSLFFLANDLEYEMVVSLKKKTFPRCSPLKCRVCLFSGSRNSSEAAKQEHRWGTRSKPHMQVYGLPTPRVTWFKGATSTTTVSECRLLNSLAAYYVTLLKSVRLLLAHLHRV